MNLVQRSAGARSSRRAAPRALGWLAAATVALAGCASTGPVLVANYEDESLWRFSSTISPSGPSLEPNPPSPTPTPSPPADVFAWGQIDVQGRIASRPGGGKWVVVRPSPSYLDSGKHHAFVLRAFSDGLPRGTAPITGGLTVAVEGGGRLVVSVRKIRPDGTLGAFLAGFDIAIAGTQSSIGYLSPQSLSVIHANLEASAPRGTQLTSARSGAPIRLQFSIDQDSRTVALGAYPAGGSAGASSVVFDALDGDGAPVVPLGRLLIDVVGFELSRDASLFFDDFRIAQ